MSSKDGSDDREPVEHDGFEEELATFLSDDWHPASRVGDESGFDISDFVAGLYDGEGVFFLPVAVEVPLATFVEAQQADALGNLEIGVDKHGQPFLVALVGSEGDQIVLVSVTLAEDES